MMTRCFFEGERYTDRDVSHSLGSHNSRLSSLETCREKTGKDRSGMGLSFQERGGAGGSGAFRPEGVLAGEPFLLGEGWAVGSEPPKQHIGHIGMSKHLELYLMDFGLIT